jgi:hypothetical protein
MSGHAASLAVVSKCSCALEECVSPSLRVEANQPRRGERTSRQTPTQGSYKDLAEQHKSFMQFTSPSTIG